MLDLFVPDLLSSAPGSPRLRFLEKWLARGDVRREDGGRHAWLARSFGIDGLPVAAIERLGDAASAGAWMRADPVFLRVQGDNVHLHDASVLAITPEDARELVATLQAHFAADGLEFVVPSPDRWYVRITQGEAPRTTALPDVIGRNVFGLLPEEPKWRSAMTEAQMILSGHDVNARREAEGKPPVNSIWFWGGGVLPDRMGKPYELVCSDDALIRGLGKRSGAQVQPALSRIAEVDYAPSVLADVTGLAADVLEEKWFGELGSAIERFDAVRLIIPSRTTTLLATLTGSSRWRWFRPSRPLSAYA